MGKKFAIIAVCLASLFFVGILVGIINVLLLAVDGSITTTDMTPAQMGSLISERLVLGAQFIIMAIIGYVISTSILVTTNYRAKWYFWCMACFSFPYIFWVPVGTSLSIVVYVFLISKRKEFFHGDANGKLEESA